MTKLDDALVLLGEVKTGVDSMGSDLAEVGTDVDALIVLANQVGEDPAKLEELVTGLQGVRDSVTTLQTTTRSVADKFTPSTPS